MHKIEEVEKLEQILIDLYNKQYRDEEDEERITTLVYLIKELSDEIKDNGIEYRGN